MKKLFKIFAACLLVLGITLPALAFTRNWSFTTPSNYSYDTDKITIEAGAAKLIQKDQTDSDNTSSGFGGGTCSNTEWSSDHLQLSSGQTSGGFISRVMDAGGSVSWSSISWIPKAPYYKELPNNCSSESSYSEGNANMTDCVLLAHFNNDPTYGESNTFVYDFSGAGHSGTPESISTNDYVAGKFRKGLDLDAGSERVKFSVPMGATVTIALWAKLDTQGHMLWCIDDDNTGPDLYFMDDNIYLNTWDGISNPFCAQPANVDQWHHYVTVIQSGSGNTKLYIDGQLAGTANYEDPSETVFFIGSSSTSYTWDGGVDELAIFNRVLSPTEVLAMYKRGASRLKFQVRCGSTSPPSGDFIGPGGTSATFYSELSNEAVGLPSLTLTNLSAGQYFQYRVSFEADSASYSPELSSVTIGPSHYDPGDPPIRPVSSQYEAFNSVTTFEETAVKNGGEIKYILSNDSGSNWLYWNSTNSSWETSDGSYSQANTAEAINAQVSSFPPGDGQFLFKAFLHSNGTQLVELDTVSLGYNLVPIVSEAVHISSQPTAGSSSVLLKASFRDPFPDQNLFYVAINGQDYEPVTAGQSDTASPAPQATSVGATLDGDDYVSQIKCEHTNDFGDMCTSESAAPSEVYRYVKPYPPASPEVFDLGSTSLKIYINKAPNEVDGVEYLIYEPNLAEIVQADGTLGSTEVWATREAWGTVEVTGLTSPTTRYAFKVKSRNPSDAANQENSESDWSEPAGGPVVSVSPEVIYYSPTSEAANVTTETTVTVTFSRPMNYNSVQNAFSLEAISDNAGEIISSEVSGSFGWSSNSTVVFTPAASLTRGYAYRVTISKEAEDYGGNQLGITQSWTFRIIFEHASQNIFRSEDGKVKVFVAVGAFAEDGGVEINRDPINSPKQLKASIIIDANNKVIAEGNPYRYPIISTITEFNAYDANGHLITDAFSAPVTISLYYDDADNDGYVDGSSPAIDENSLLIYRLDESNSLWVKVPASTVNTAANYVTAAVQHFSVYSLMAEAKTTLSSAYAYPVPFRPDAGHTGITFANLASQCTIKVFDSAGDLVATLNESDGDGRYVWDVTNSYGKDLSSGVYFYHIRSSEDTRAGKIMVVR